MSSLVVTSRLAAMIPTAGKDERLEEFLPAPPTTLRDFGNGRYVGVLRGNVRGSSKAGPPMPLQASVEDEQGRAVGPSVTCRRCLRHARVLARRCTAPAFRSRICGPARTYCASAPVLLQARRPKPGSWRFVCGPRRNPVGQLVGRPDCRGCRRGGERRAGARNGRRTDRLRMGGALESAAPQTDGPGGHLRQHDGRGGVPRGEAHRRLRRSHCRHQAGGRYTGGGVHGAEPAANRG